jgi:lysyl-tRNA synthetase, class II
MADELLAVRRAKLDRLRTDGIDPFPHEFAGVEPAAEVLAAHEALQAGEETASRHRVAGRLAARRGQGKMAFLDLVDRSGRLQLQARQDVVGPSSPLLRAPTRRPARTCSGPSCTSAC